MRLYRKKGISLFFHSKKFKAIKDLMGFLGSIRKMKNEIESTSPTIKFN